MRALQWKEWRLSMSPVPLLFLLLSGLILIPNYPYYVTFFYNGLGLFMLMQSLRENRDTAYLMLLPVTKAEMVRARFRTVVQLELLQVLACVPFMALRASYGHLNNAVGIEANTAFLGLGLVQMGLFNLVFFPMHYKNAYDLGKPFVAASVVEFFYIVLAEVCDHVAKTCRYSVIPAHLSVVAPLLTYRPDQPVRCHIRGSGGRQYRFPRYIAGNF